MSVTDNIRKVPKSTLYNSKNPAVSHIGLYIGLAVIIVVIIIIIIIIIIVFLIRRRKNDDGAKTSDTTTIAPVVTLASIKNFTPTTAATKVSPFYYDSTKLNQTYIPPTTSSGVTHIVVEIIGAGGSGAVTSTTSSATNSVFTYGGSAGGYLKLIFTPSEFSKYTSGINVNISPGGIPTNYGYVLPPANIAYGNPASDTSFGSATSSPIYFISKSGSGGSDTGVGGGHIDFSVYKDDFTYVNQFFGANGDNGSKFTLPSASQNPVAPLPARTIWGGGAFSSYKSGYGAGGDGLITAYGNNPAYRSSKPGQGGAIIISEYKEPS